MELRSGSPEDAEEIAIVIERLAMRFPDVPLVEVAEITREVHIALTGRPIRRYVPVFVERDARDRLRERARHG
ncbi:three-helix bundle dimerization domain-containing protein [Microbacterium terregens]|uniref:Three-helix bundle dimerization domain-containing protein n=1 Tax=Microbacterium terregens TaxID=69363 RepID=A0ABV5T3V4_9MICO